MNANHQPPATISPNRPATHPVGRTSWALGLAAFLPLQFVSDIFVTVPFMNLIVAGLAMIAVYVVARLSKGAEVAEHARGAGNWGLTLLTLSIPCLAQYSYFRLFLPGYVDPIGLGVKGLLVLFVIHVFLTINGTVSSGTGPHHTRLAIPYIRLPRTLRAPKATRHPNTITNRPARTSYHPLYTPGAVRAASPVDQASVDQASVYLAPPPAPHPTGLASWSVGALAFVPIAVL
ncbi:MAG TPA: hypothetical protein VJP90_09365 [Paenarthrobacter sp.]|nr:hypothetical protein [Paenarthrobacter sp.]